MADLMATATCTAFRAVEEVTGESVASRLLVERVGWLAALTRQMTAAVVARHWNDEDLRTVESGVGPDARALPVKGWMAMANVDADGAMTLDPDFFVDFGDQRPH